MGVGRGTGAGIVRAFGERSLGWLEYWSLGEEGPRGLMSVGRRSLDSCFIKSNLQANELHCSDILEPELLTGLTRPYPFSLGLRDYSYKTGGLGNMSLAGLEFTLEPRGGVFSGTPADTWSSRGEYVSRSLTFVLEDHHETRIRRGARG